MLPMKRMRSAGCQPVRPKAKETCPGFVVAAEETDVLDDVKTVDLATLGVDVKEPTATAIGKVAFDDLGALVVLHVDGVAAAAQVVAIVAEVVDQVAVHLQVQRRRPRTHAHRTAKDIAIDHLQADVAGVHRGVVEMPLLQGVPEQVADLQSHEVYVFDAAQSECAVEVSPFAGCRSDDDGPSRDSGDPRRERQAIRHALLGLAHGAVVPAALEIERVAGHGGALVRNGGRQIERLVLATVALRRTVGRHVQLTPRHRASSGQRRRKQQDDHSPRPGRVQHA